MSSAVFDVDSGVEPLRARAVFIRFLGRQGAPPGAHRFLELHQVLDGLFGQKLTELLALGTREPREQRREARDDLSLEGTIRVDPRQCLSGPVL